MTDNYSHNFIQPSGSQIEPRILGSQTRVTKEFKCEVCLKSLSSKHCLQEHQHTHTNEKPYNCLVCLKSFKYASQFSTHKKQHLTLREPRWPRLTDLLKSNIYQQDVPEILLLIELPTIKEPSPCELPKFSFR